MARQQEQEGDEGATARPAGGRSREGRHHEAPDREVHPELAGPERRKLGEGANTKQFPIAQATAPRHDAQDQGPDPVGAQGLGGAHGDPEEGRRDARGRGASEGQEAARHDARGMKRCPFGAEDVLKPMWLDASKKKELQKKARKLDTAFQEAIRVYHAVRREATNRAAEGEEVQWGERPTCFEIGGPGLMIREAFREVGMKVLEPAVFPESPVKDEDVVTNQEREAIIQQIVLGEPELVWACPPPLAGSNMSIVTGNRPSRAAKRQCKAMAGLAADAFDTQAAAGRMGVVTHPAGSDLWDTPALHRLCSEWGTYVFYYDLEAFGDEENQPNIRMKAVASHLALAEALAFQNHRPGAAHKWFPLKGFGANDIPEHFGRMVVQAAVATKGKNPDEHHRNPSEELEAYPAEKEHDSHLGDPGAEAISFDPRVPKPIQAALKRIHQNLGHLPNEDLARHLKMSGASVEAVKAAKTLRCRTCQACSRPASARPAKPVPVLDFNDVLGLDVIHLEDALGHKHLGLSMVDYASTYHLVTSIPDTKASTITEAVRKAWILWAGPPRAFALDLDSGFKDVFEDLCAQCNAYMSHAAGQAHWQHGLVERHNGVWKAVWAKIVEANTLVGYELDWGIDSVNNAKNLLRNKDGYSPRQWVFGVNPRLLGDVVDEPHAAATLSALSTDSKLQRQNAIRQAARVAFIQVQTDQALQRSLLHRSRVKKTHYEYGDLVYVYRERKPTKGKKAIKMWLGPCTVIGAEGQNLWVSRGGRCLLCAPEHMRPAEPEELGELLKVKASLDNIQELLDGKGVQDWAFETAEGDEQPDREDEEPTDEIDELMRDYQPGSGDQAEETIQMDNMDWDSVVLERRRKLLDDVPLQFKKARVARWHAQKTLAKSNWMPSCHGQPSIRRIDRSSSRQSRSNGASTLNSPQ